VQMAWTRRDVRRSLADAKATGTATGRPVRIATRVRGWLTVPVAGVRWLVSRRRMAMTIG